MSIIGRVAPFLTATPAPLLSVVGTTQVSASSSGVISAPAGIQAGDIVIIAAWATDSSASWGTPSGFTDIFAGPGQGGVIMKVAGGSEPSSYTYSNGGTYVGLFCAVLRGPTALDAIGTATTTSAATTITASAVTAVAANCVLIACYGSNGNVNFSTPTGMTSIGRSTDPATGLFYQQLTATGSTGTRTTTPSGSGYDSGSVMFTLKY